ncbi:hypothetical protein AFR_06140 [Actinoplanes friuliensis DSM 7358]|uniref:Uncharacterized protein n=1 Tax=Actinoplanes friuliensis DSM 7358 TaxID=1246995 RepID=U5VRS3_9ACTN|nr:hypothetical protein AFR_06140 [Actinoplanes friuliensis DSM 7358]
MRTNAAAALLSPGGQASISFCFEASRRDFWSWISPAIELSAATCCHDSGLSSLATIAQMRGVL